MSEQTITPMELTPVEELYEVHLYPSNDGEKYVFKVHTMTIDRVNGHILFNLTAPYAEKDFDYFGNHPMFSKIQIFSSDLQTVYKTEEIQMRAIIAKGDFKPHNWTTLNVLLSSGVEEEENTPNEEEQENGVS